MIQIFHFGELFVVGLQEMGSKSVVDMIEASSRVHYSGFHMNGVEPRSSLQETTCASADIQRQPFVIGLFCCSTILCTVVDKKRSF